jgi:hypothetical protein
MASEEETVTSNDSVRDSQSRPARSQFGLSDEGRKAFASIRQANALPNRRVLGASQFVTLELLADTIHPADDGFPGAMEWRVADYVDILLSESDDVTRLQWLSGLAELDRESISGFGIPFGRLTDAQRVSLVAEIYRERVSRESTLETFIDIVELATVCACFAADMNAAEATAGH